MQPEIPHLPMRRRDRAVKDDAWIAALLERSPVGALATSGQDHPHLVPNLFVFDAPARSIYLHTAREGVTRRAFEIGAPTTFCVWEMGRLLPAPEAVHFSVEYRSVVVQGRGEVLHGETARRALALFMAKYAPQLVPGRDYVATRDQDLQRTSVLCLRIEGWSGKCKQEQEDFPGAYSWEPASR